MAAMRMEEEEGKLRVEREQVAQTRQFAERSSRL